MSREFTCPSLNLDQQTEVHSLSQVHQTEASDPTTGGTTRQRMGGLEGWRGSSRIWTCCWTKELPPLWVSCICHNLVSLLYLLEVGSKLLSHPQTPVGSVPVCVKDTVCLLRPSTRNEYRRHVEVSRVADVGVGVVADDR